MIDRVEDLLTISIATKDRPDVLDATLRRLHAFGLGGCEVLVCDDGSSPPLAPPAFALFPHARLLRNPVALGQAIARNQIAAAATRPYILQLDDDSYPVAGSLAAVVDAARERDDWIAIALPLEEPSRGQNASVPATPFTPLRSFVGCAALINRRVFQDLGGYADWIGRTVEEDELCIRAHRRGLLVIASGDLQIRHDVTAVQRSLTGIEYRSFRNWTATWLRHAPFPEVVVQVLRLAAAATWTVIRSWRTAALRGWAAAVTDVRAAIAARAPMRRDQYRAYVRLPHALQVLSTDA